MTDKPHMTLLNGDKLAVGDYGRTRDKRKVKIIGNDGSSVPFLVDHGAYDNWHLQDGSSNIGRKNDDIIAKWTEEPAQPEAPKPLGEMTDAEIGALVRAWNEGREIQYWSAYCFKWVKCRVRPAWNGRTAYRIRPEPKRETVAICYRAPHGQWREIGTIDLSDGKPARDSVKIEVGDA